MHGLSLAGTELAYLAALPLVYWCIDRRRGLRIALLVFVSSAVNLGLKSAFAQPRPYDIDPSVGLAREPTYGLPSAHAQVTAVFGGTAGPLIKRPWGLVFAIALPLLVGLSRIYLGAHFPTDVLAGWALGAAFVGLDRLLGDRISAAVAGLRETIALALAAAIALGMNVLYMKDVSLGGAFFGLAAGAIYGRRSAPFSVAGAFWKRALRYLFGMATLAIVYAAPKLLLAEIEASGPPLVRFLRYFLLGLWVAIGAPWLFVKLGLATREDHSANENDLSVISK
jgi:hypothetical protein